jgi:transcriptional regulator with XRE-family HTH domain
VKVKHPNLIKLGKTIRRLREERGYSQEDFAAVVEIDRSYMGGIERGERNVATLNLIRIAKALDVEVGELFPSVKSLS